MNPIHLLRYVIDTALQYLADVEPRINSRPARALLLGTAMVESDLKHLQQGGDGLALGLWQMEPATHDDLWETWLEYRPEWAEKYRFLAVTDACGIIPMAEEMRWNLVYAASMARLRYWREPDALPAMCQKGLAEYWKKIYNSRFGAGTVEKAEPKFKQALYLVEAYPQTIAG